VQELQLDGRTAPAILASHPPARDEVEHLRSREYDLLATLLGRAPTRRFVDLIGQIEGDGSALGRAHQSLAAAARSADPNALSREFFDLFIGVGRGELLPYASYYLTGFLNERPLARVREDMAAIGIERAERVSDPEDHIAILFDTMASLASGRVDADPGQESRFFARHLEPWAGRFFADLEVAKSARFYRHVAALGRLYMDIESEAFAIEA